MTGLALFDIDGTLTASNEIDTECFVRAFREEFGLTEIATGWQHYEHSTDRGIAAEVLQRAWHRPATEGELTRHRTRFVEMLRHRAHEIAAIPGACEFVDHVLAAGWQVGIITGAWSDSARLKLRAAGFPELPLVSCDTFLSRPEIVRCAISQWGAGNPAGGRRDRRRSTVLFGDGTWDYAAATQAGIGFIGIGSGDGATRLRAAGARAVFPDYRERDAIFDGMLRAQNLTSAVSRYDRGA